MDKSKLLRKAWDVARQLRSYPEKQVAIARLLNYRWLAIHGSEDKVLFERIQKQIEEVEPCQQK